MTSQYTHCYIDNEPFLGRVKEQERFREALAAVLREKDSLAMPFVFLIYGDIGMGKTRLADRLGSIALEDQPFKGHFRVIRLDWERCRNLAIIDRDYALATYGSVSPEIIFRYIYGAFRDAGFGRKFDPYEKVVKDRLQAETKVAQILSQTVESRDDWYAKLREIGGKGLAWLLRTGVPAAAVIPEEPMAKGFEAILGVGQEALPRLRETATTLLRSKLNPDEFDLFTSPTEILARRLADGIRDSAAHKPIVVILDAYQIVDYADLWLREVMKHAGLQVVWVLVRRYAYCYQREQRDPSSYWGVAASERDRVHIFSVGNFSSKEVEKYFATCVPERLIDASGIEAIYKMTFGIPLAVREAAIMWKSGVSLKDIVNAWPGASRAQVVEVMMEQVLSRCLNPARPDDRLRLYALALAYWPDPDLLAAMMQSDNIKGDLKDLEQRYSSLFADETRLRDAWTTFLCQYLLRDINRKSNEVRGLHERAMAHLRARRQARESALSTLEARLRDDVWTTATLGLVHHGFWLQEDEGWPVLMPALVAGLMYDLGFARALVKTVNEPLATTLTRSGHKRLRLLQKVALRSADRSEAAFWNELEESASTWPDDVCSAERQAILDFWRGQRLCHQQKYVDAAACYERVVQGLPPKGDMLRIRLGEAMTDLAGNLLWPVGQSDAVCSSEAEHMLSKVVQWLPQKQNAWYRWGVALERHRGGDPKKWQEAVHAYQKAIDLDPQDARSWCGLGNVCQMLGKNYEDDAIDAYQRAIAIDPNLPSAYNGLGNVYTAQGDAGKALAAYEHAIALAPDLANPYKGLGSLHRALGRYEDAIAVYRRAIELNPKDTDSYTILGLLCQSLGYYDEALEFYRQLIRLSKTYSPAYVESGNLYRTLGRYEEAIVAYRRAIELDKKYAYAHHNLGKVYAVLSRYSEALVEYEFATDSDPGTASYHASLSACCRQLGQEADYQRHITAALRMMERDSDYDKACINAVAGRTEAALENLARALAQSPGMRGWAQHDPDLANLQNDPRFKGLVGSEK